MDVLEAWNRRARTEGTTWFFTVNLLQRRNNDLLVWLAGDEEGGITQ